MAENVIPRIPQLDYDPEWGELFTSAFRTENTVGSAVQRLKNSRLFGDSDATPVTDAEINKAVEDEGMTAFVNHFTSVETRGDLNNKIAHMRQQMHDKAVLDKGGWAGFGAQLTAGMFDAPTLVPFGHAVKLGRLGTESLKTTASKLAMTAAIDAGSTEAALHLTQDLRTPEESALAVGGAMLLTTALGTTLSRYLSRRHFDDLSKRVEEELPKIADGRAEIEVADQIAQASANTARVIEGKRPEPHVTTQDRARGTEVFAFLDRHGVKGVDALEDLPEGTMRAVLVGPNGKLFDLTDSPFDSHLKYMRAVEDSGSDALFNDSISNMLQLTVSKQRDVVDIATGSKTPLNKRQLAGVRKAASSYNIDQRDLWFREDRDGVSIISARNHESVKGEGFLPLSRYDSAGHRARMGELQGKPSEDPELRQGLPNTRWDGEAKPRADVDMEPWTKLPAPQPGFIRFYHGGPNTGGIDGQRWVSPDPKYARDYRGLSKLYYIDIPETSPLLREATDTSGTNMPKVYAAFEVPADVAKRDMKLLYDYGAPSVGDATPPIGTSLVGSPPAGGKGGGTEPPSGGKGGSGTPPNAIEGPESPYAPKLTPSEIAFANSGGAIAVTRGVSRLFGGNPILEMMHSTSQAARQWIAHVAELSGRTKGAYEGRVNPIAIQSRMTEYEGMRAQMTRDFYDAYKGWRQGWDIRGKEFERFSRLVSQSIVRNTFDLPGTDPNVAKGALAIRKVISNMYERAVEQGLIRKDAWKPGDRKDPFVDFNAARQSATDAEFDVKDYVDFYVKSLADEIAKGYGNGRNSPRSKGSKGKFSNESPNFSRLTQDDAELYGQIAADAERGVAAFSDADAATNVVPFHRETGSRLARGGQTDGDLDYNIGLRFTRGASGELDDSLTQTGGLINRRYTDKVAHERHDFIRAEALAELQDRDVQIRAARKQVEEIRNKAREDATAKGEDPEAAAASVKIDKRLSANANAQLWHEIKNRPARQARLVSAMNHAVGSWEFIVHGTIKDGDARVLQLEAQGLRSPLHRRNVKLSDEVLLAKGWIDDDALGIANHTVRQIASDVELARQFRRPMSTAEANSAATKNPDAWWIDGADPTTVPDLGMQVPRQIIGREFGEALNALSSDPANDAARNRIISERARILGGTDADGRQKQGMLDVALEMTRGTHKIAENATPTALNLQALKSFIFSARMGANVITNIGDVGAVILRHGLGNLMHHYAVRSADMVRSLTSAEAIGNLATKWELPPDRVGAVLAREARAAGIAVETDLMSRMASQMDLFDPFRNAKAKDTTFQQTSDWLARAGSKVYLINAWTNAIRKASYGIYVDRVARMAMQPEQIAKHERVWLNDLGIDDAMLAGIRREITDNDGAVFDGGVWHVLADNWQDTNLRSLFWAAGRKDVNSSNVSPSVLEKPLAFTNPIVNTMLQFWSFSFGATMRIMGQSAQRIINGTDGLASDGTRTLLGIGAMVGLGMGTYALHNLASTWRQRQNGTLDPKDELPDFNENWRQWMIQGVARSGVFGVFSQMGDVADNLGVNFPRQAFRSFDQDPDLTDPIKRYGRPNAVKNVFGPSAGLLDDVISAGRGIAYGSIYRDEDIKRANVRAIVRNTPLINSFYLKSMTKEAVEYLADDILKLPPDRK